jgi:hypothetical protein
MVMPDVGYTQARFARLLFTLASWQCFLSRLSGHYEMPFSMSLTILTGKNNITNDVCHLWPVCADDTGAYTHNGEQMTRITSSRTDQLLLTARRSSPSA